MSTVNLGTSIRAERCRLVLVALGIAIVHAKAAGAVCTLHRLQLAKSSALGALRHAERFQYLGDEDPQPRRRRVYRRKASR